jgi:hypothetical protein
MLSRRRPNEEMPPSRRGGLPGGNGAAGAAGWLRRSQGFEVVSPDGHVGFVEDVLPEGEAPDALVVRSGRFRRRALAVPVDEVAEIAPRQTRLVLRRSPRRSWRLRALVSDRGWHDRERHAAGRPAGALPGQARTVDRA